MTTEGTFMFLKKIVDKLVRVLLNWSQKKMTLKNKYLSLILGSLVFFILLPGSLFLLGRYVDKLILIEWPSSLEVILGLITIPSGLFFLIWAMITQWRIGKGTPTPTAPTQKLIIQGPYKLCRNPIVFGELQYYFGLGTLFGSLTNGFICFLVSFIGMSIYYKFVEEKELLKRFGQNYAEYRDSTPFYIPKIWPNKESE